MKEHEEHLLVFSQLQFLSWVAKLVGCHTNAKAVAEASTEADAKGLWMVLLSVGFLVAFLCGAFAYALSSDKASSQIVSVAKITDVGLVQAK